MSVTIRTVQPNDIHFLMTLEHEAFTEDCWESQAVYLERIAVFPNGFLVLEVDGIPAGAICGELWHGRKNIDVDTFSLGHSIAQRHDEQGDELYISSVAILPAFRGHHYGFMLVTHLMKQITQGYPRVNRFILIVSADWLSAYHTYQRIGFATEVIISDFFGGTTSPKSHGIVMTKFLSQSSDVTGKTRKTKDDFIA